jgi:hypothetical protein
MRDIANICPGLTRKPGQAGSPVESHLCAISGMESLHQERLGEALYLLPDGAEEPENGQTQPGELMPMTLIRSLPVNCAPELSDTITYRIVDALKELSQQGAVAGPHPARNIAQNLGDIRAQK